MAKDSSERDFSVTKVHRSDLSSIAFCIKKIREQKQVMAGEIAHATNMFQNKVTAEKSAREIISYMKDHLASGEIDRQVLPLIDFFNNELSWNTKSQIAGTIKQIDPDFYKKIVSLGFREP
jgi:hypothetical protein